MVWPPDPPGYLIACGISTVFHPCAVIAISGAVGSESVHFFLATFEVSAASGWWYMAAQQPVVVLAWYAEVASASQVKSSR